MPSVLECDIQMGKAHDILLEADDVVGFISIEIFSKASDYLIWKIIKQIS